MWKLMEISSGNSISSVFPPAGSAITPHRRVMAVGLLGTCSLLCQEEDGFLGEGRSFVGC